MKNKVIAFFIILLILVIIFQGVALGNEKITGHVYKFEPREGLKKACIRPLKNYEVHYIYQDREYPGLHHYAYTDENGEYTIWGYSNYDRIFFQVPWNFHHIFLNDLNIDYTSPRGIVANPRHLWILSAILQGYIICVTGSAGPYEDFDFLVFDKGTPLPIIDLYTFLYKVGWLRICKTCSYYEI